MRATVIVDNICNGSCGGEWGLSIYIEYEGKKILYDAGASSLFARNAEKLNIPLSQVDYGVLSHAHYDHANGMEEFFRLNNQASFYLQSACGENCYKRVLFFNKYIGIPRGILEKESGRICHVSGNCQLAEGISLISHSTPGLDAIGSREKMYVRNARRWQPDDFAHEQSLVFDTPKGLVVFNGCCHGGLENIIRETAEAFPGRPIYALTGGFHLFNKPEAEVHALALRMKDMGIERIYTGHCTGEKAFEILRRELGESITQLKVGLTMEF